MLNVINNYNLGVIHQRRPSKTDFLDTPPPLSTNIVRLEDRPNLLPPPHLPSTDILRVKTTEMQKKYCDPDPRGWGRCRTAIRIPETPNKNRFEDVRFMAEHPPPSNVVHIGTPHPPVSTAGRL